MDTTLFYIAGGVLIAGALLLTFIGLRSDRFPSDRMVVPGVVAAAGVVAVTAVGAVKLAQHEQEHRIGEANAAADVEAASEQQAGQQAGAGTEPTPAGNGQSEGGGSAGAAAGSSGIDGGQVFVATGCGGCHTLKALGSDAQGTVGPDLDTALADKDAKFIETSIVDPSAYVAEGFPDGTMPANYKEQLSPGEIQALVDFLLKSTGTGSSGSGSSSG